MNAERAPQPWYFESTQGAYFNEWTWTHFAWGLVSWHFLRSHPVGVLLHTVYEIFEGSVFPGPTRDVSFQNHMGDTAAFLAGSVVGQLYSRKVN